MTYYNVLTINGSFKIDEEKKVRILSKNNMNVWNISYF